MRHLTRAMVSAALPLLLVSDVRADAGSPLMWTSFLHLAVGNALIGAAEGALLATMFGAALSRGTLMIPANYLSMVAGCFLMAFLPLPDVTIHTFWVYTSAAAAVFFAVTVVIEWPFAWLLLRDVPRRFRRSVIGVLLVNIASYAALAPIYWRVSDFSLLSETHQDQTLLADQPADESIHYLSTDLRHVCRVAMNGASLETVMGISEAPEYPRLVAELLAPGSWRLALESSGRSQQRIALTPVSAEQMGVPDTPGRWEVNSDLRARTTDWGARCVHYDPFLRLETPTGSRMLIVHTPFITWGLGHVTNLPGDRAVFQLGDQIELLHMPTMRLALIARGRSPVVAINSSQEPH